MTHSHHTTALCPLLLQLISFIPFVLLFLLLQCRSGGGTSRSATPLLSDSALRIFVSFAVGGMLGDAFLHLIPHAISPHSHDEATVSSSPLVQYLTSLLPVLSAAHPPLATPTALPFSLPPTSASHSHSHDSHHEHGHSHGEAGEMDGGMRAGLLVLVGIALFFIVEKVARMRAGADADEHAGHSHSHSGHPRATNSNHSDMHTATNEEQSSNHSHGVYGMEKEQGPEDVEGPAAAVVKRRRGRDGQRRSSSPTPSKSPSPTRRRKSTSRTPNTATVDDTNSVIALSHITPPTYMNASLTDKVAGSARSSQAALTGLLNLLADLSHNFTDGLAITASFLSSPALGVSTSLAVLVHEVPHELGDFAILLQAGFTLQQALWMQLVTAIGAVIGVAVMWLSGGRGEGAAWVLPVTAGGFVYVALVNVVPSLLKEQTDVDKPLGVWRWVQLAAEMTAMLVGVSLMVALGEME